MNRSRVPVYVLVGWTVFLWVSRLRNVFADDDLSTAGTTWRVVVVIVFVALAGVVVVALRSGRPSLRIAVGVLAAWTVIFWLVRGTGILLDGDHDAGFKAVHTALMAASISVAVWALTATRRPTSRPSAPAARS